MPDRALAKRVGSALARIFLNNCAGVSSPPITARLRYNPLIH